MSNAQTGPSGSNGGAFSLVVKIRCPHCGTPIPQPFYRARTPVVNTHFKNSDPHGPRCRIVVVCDPYGEKHEVHRLREGETKDEALERIGRLLAA